MRKNLLSGVMLLFISAYSYGQFGLSNDDAVDVSEVPPTEIINFNDLPANGRVAGYFNNSSIRYNASIKDSRFHGEWKSWYENKAIRDEGHLKKGIPDGEWKVWYSNGNLHHIRTYSFDKYKRITQEWKRPNPRMPNYGLTDIYLRNRKQAVIRTKQNYSFRKSETEYTAVFNDCLLHGLYMNFNENGITKDSGYYQNGLREGVWIETNKDGNYMMGSYKKSQRTGVWKVMNRNKSLLSIITYKNGQEDWRKVFNKN